MSVTTPTPAFGPLLPFAGQNMLLEARLDGERSVDWLKANATKLESLVAEQGLVLIRGLNLMTSKQFGAALAQIFAEPLAQYQYRSTPRVELRGQVYTASEYHPDMTILQHNESSYANCWAMRVGFYCQQVASQGGATPVSDSRKIFQQIDPDVVAEFTAKKLKYVRNYGLIDLPWQEVFQTDDKAEVESYCQQNGLSLQWTDKGLRTEQVNPAVAKHPVSGEMLWFNQAHLFHQSALPSDVSNNLANMYQPIDMPRNCFFADGSEIPSSMLAHIREVYEQNIIEFAWQTNDLMLLDNMLFTHGRTPFSGERKVLVGMARSCDWQQCELATTNNGRQA